MQKVSETGDYSICGLLLSLLLLLLACVIVPIPRGNAVLSTRMQSSPFIAYNNQQLGYRAQILNHHQLETLPVWLN